MEAAGPSAGRAGQGPLPAVVPRHEVTGLRQVGAPVRHVPRRRRAGPARLRRRCATAAEAALVQAAVPKGREGQARAPSRWRCRALPEAMGFRGGAVAP